MLVPVAHLPHGFLVDPRIKSLKVQAFRQGQLSSSVKKVLYFSLASLFDSDNGIGGLSREMPSSALAKSDAGAVPLSS